MVNMLGLNQNQAMTVHGLAALLTGADFHWDDFLLEVARAVAEANMHDSALLAAVHVLLSKWAVAGYTIAGFVWDRWSWWQRAINS